MLSFTRLCKVMPSCLIRMQPEYFSYLITNFSLPCLTPLNGTNCYLTFVNDVGKIIMHFFVILNVILKLVVYFSDFSQVHNEGCDNIAISLERIS